MPLPTPCRRFGSLDRIASRDESAMPDIHDAASMGTSPSRAGNALPIHGGADVAGWRPQRRQRWMGRILGPDVCCPAPESGAPIPQESVIAPP